MLTQSQQKKHWSIWNICKVNIRPKDDVNGVLSVYILDFRQVTFRESSLPDSV